MRYIEFIEMPTHHHTPVDLDITSYSHRRKGERIEVTMERMLDQWKSALRSGKDPFNSPRLLNGLVINLDPTPTHSL